jgi:hypothetical protein
MSEFFDSLKADLLDRRLLPILALVAVALLAAVGYAALGGGGSSTATPTAASSPSPQTSTKAASISVTPASTGSQQPVAETTDGVSHQHGGASRNPFSPLPGAKTASTSSSTDATASSPSTSGSSSSSAPPAPTKSSGGTSPAPTKPLAPAKPQTVYQVAVLFGVAPPVSISTPSSSQLTPYGNLKRLQPLPSSTAPLVVFRGVTAGGGSATFTLVGEAILRGNAACLPSASQCQAIDLKPGLIEELEYLPPSGQAIVYQLKVVSITAVKASAAKAASLFHVESKTGRELLRRDGLAELPWLRYAADRGVLVFAGHPAFAARAHAARHR